jgi:receptor expression-enhancing protein 5/6
LYENENKTLAEAFETFERKTGTKREYAAYGAGFIIACYLIVGSCAELLCNLIGFAYPAYVSVKAIRTEDKVDLILFLNYAGFFLE